MVRTLVLPPVSYTHLDVYKRQVVCFQKAFDYRLKGSNRDMLHDISINLADAFVRTGHYDKGP